MLNKIKFLECITDEAKDTQTDSKENLFATNFCIMAGELTSLVLVIENIFNMDEEEYNS